MVPTENTYLLAEHLPNARLSIYPDAGDGASTSTGRRAPATPDERRTDGG
jgi:hypothetical protein